MIYKLLTSMNLLTILLTVLLFTQTYQKCAYKVHPDGRPEHVQSEPHNVTGLTQCIQYNDKFGCCDENNDNSQVLSYKQLDGVFGSQGGGCDVCSINLKRFWCEYACSPRQADFMKTSVQFYPYPDPKDPNNMVMVQVVNLTVHADTACALYNSCKRIGFVTSVSAMSSPAGFLNFQGHNAVDDAFQYINVKFSYQKNDSLYFSDQKKETEPERSALQMCNYTSPASVPLHGFDFLKNFVIVMVDFNILKLLFWRISIGFLLGVFGLALPLQVGALLIGGIKAVKKKFYDLYILIIGFVLFLHRKTNEIGFIELEDHKSVNFA